MSPGIGLMKRRLEKEKDAIALAVSGIAKKYDIQPENIKTLETRYDDMQEIGMLLLDGMRKKLLFRWIQC